MQNFETIEGNLSREQFKLYTELKQANLKFSNILSGNIEKLKKSFYSEIDNKCLNTACKTLNIANNQKYFNIEVIGDEEKETLMKEYDNIFF